MTRHIQSPGIVRTLCKHFEGYFGIFRDIDTYSSTLTGVQLGRRGSGFPTFIQNPVIFAKIGKTLCNPGNSETWHIDKFGIFRTLTYLKSHAYAEPSQR